MENDTKKKSYTCATCVCKECRRSSVAGSVCAFEEQDDMCFCPTFIRIKENKKP